MTWVEVTPAQVAEAEAWWNARTPAERERDYPKKLYGLACAFFPCGWRVFSGAERAYTAMALMDAGLIPTRKPVTSESPKQVQEKRSL